MYNDFDSMMDSLPFLDRENDDDNWQATLRNSSKDTAVTAQLWLI